jgi:hypothetical protein
MGEICSTVGEHKKWAKNAYFKTQMGELGVDLKIILQ